MKAIKCFAVLWLVGVAFWCGTVYNKPQVVIHDRVQNVEIRIPESLPVMVPVYQTNFREFASWDELSQWQAAQYLDLQVLGKQKNWICVDYALEMQQRAWQDGYQMSTENLIDPDGKAGHAICSTWIGDMCYYLEPQDVKSWIGAQRAD